MPVNEAVTDSVTQVNTTVLGETPAMAQGNLLMSNSHAMANAAHDSTGANQQAVLVHQTVTTQGINALFATGSTVLSRSAQLILKPSSV